MIDCDEPRRNTLRGHFTHGHLLSLFTRAPRAHWRFDVDFSLDAAVRMAEFAETAGVKGTFYILGTGSAYNPFSLAGVRAIEQIAAHGHRVGMHVDERDGPNAYVAAGRARDLFARRFDGVMDVRLVSFHMPTEHVLWRDFVLLESAYASRWKGHYVSDSRREWDADKEARLVANGGEGIQCNLHPAHWFGGC